MGSLCSKSYNEPDHPFEQPGRVLGSNTDAAQPSRAPLPPQQKKSGGSTTRGGGGGGRTLGGGGDDTRQDGGASAAGSAAARAAQGRAAKSASTSNKGKLGSQLAAQKAQTRNDTLNEASRNERAAKDADDAAAARRWD